MLEKKLIRLALVLFGSLGLLFLAWFVWSELNPAQERELRILAREKLVEWFPEEMSPQEDQVGFVRRAKIQDREDVPDVLLLHGLDEPGGIWDELVWALEQAGIQAWEFRYPNDQAIDASADLLAEYWSRLPKDHAPVLIGHSMGGLVIRDFVTRWRYAETKPGLDGAGIQGVILVGTPNQGSQWARLRAWLQLRELLVDIHQQRFCLFAGLRDGTGAAKIDLRPESAFLNELNSRSWPEGVPVRIIGGLLAEATSDMQNSLQALSKDLGAEELAKALEEMWSDLGQGLGDGVVPITSLQLDFAPDPIILEASHRGLLVSGPLNEERPPAIEPLLNILAEWGLP